MIPNKYKFLIVVLFCATLFSLSWAVGLEDRQYGLEKVGFSARSIAMGGVGVIGSTSAMDAIRNPAQLQYFGKHFQVETFLEMPQTIESRSFPIYDSFNGVLAENQYVSNSMGSGLYGGAVAFSLLSESRTSFHVALFTLPLIDYEYRFVEEVRDRFSTGGLQDRVRGRVEDKTDGSRQWSGFALSMPVTQRIHTGVTVGLINGKVSDEYRINRILPSDSIAVIKYTREPDNAHIQAHLGIAYELNPRLKLGWNFTYRGSRDEKIESTIIDSTTRTSKSIVSRDFPISSGIALEFIPGQMLRSKFITEFEWTNWKSSTLDNSNLSLYNTLAIRAGVEHRVLPEVPVRFGYQYSPSPFNNEMSVSYLSAGTGYERGNWIMDLGIQFGHVTSKGDDPVSDAIFGGQPRNDQDRIQTRSIRMAVTIKYLLGAKL